jgi:ribosomal protein L15
MGMGPMTGRAAGFCAGYNMPGYANPALGRGYGMGRGCDWGRGVGGGGRGWRNQFFATGLPFWARFGGYPVYAPQITPEQERMALQAQADAMQAEMEAIRKRLAEIESEEKKAK